MLFTLVYWAYHENRLLGEIKNSLTKLKSEREINHSMVIHLLENCIEIDKSEICGNPMNNDLLVRHILDNFHIMNKFPEHKKIIKKILYLN